MPSKIKLSFLSLPLLAITFLLFAKNSPVEAVWTFDGFNPLSAMSETFKTSDKITPKMTIRDNLTLTYNSSTKTYYFIITGSSTPPTSIPSTRCSTTLITSSTLPCKIEFKFGDSGVNILAGGDGKSASAEKNIGPFSANSDYYIYGKINQDDAGNSGLISTTPILFRPTPPTRDPFLQTKEGDVHTNEGITNPGGR